MTIKPNQQTVEALKASGAYYAAGATSYAVDGGRFYGVHFGMRSERDHAIRQFEAGYDHAERFARDERVLAS